MKINKKVLTVIATAAIVAWLVLSNTVLAGFSGTYVLHDGREWTGIAYKVSEGDADKFSAELSGPHTIKVKYRGSYDCRVEMILENEAGETARYELLLYQERDLATNSWVIESELNETETEQQPDDNGLN